ncbi:MAG: hypothetical protein A3G00_00530 [Candidatus Magasanikbacteria bacterium RIFCSPLOWO2_12_FULL_43_12]|uniref:Uncharacterized protein n=1 Tax=Candidatus Magasanikbacteria bacterium RIFCSPLOWO2_12_FULL_43_12 TaxID=1798692 RepID=A0A1F6MV20_9BACT|nr:MAG: hypothetical protein A3G00_00530 [Candidatus Magasanikbacteria bacterium RIFCSPLOWO2_12_FULL_43_12]
MTDLLKLGKKVFTVSVVVMTILWSVGVSALVPLVAVAVECPELETGDLFKVPDNSAVYYVNADMERVYFFNSEVYHTWYEDFSGVVTIDQTCVGAYPSGGGASYLPGSVLIKTVISPNVFAVLPNGDIKKIASEAAAKALYGDNWAKSVRDLPDVYYDTYDEVSGEVDGTKPHDGMLVKKGTVTYKVEGGALHEVDGSLPAFVAKYVQSPAATVVDALEVADTTVTAASVTEDASQMEATETTTTTTTETTTTETTTTVGGNLTVSLAADTPTGGYALASASRLSFTKVVFKAGDADVTIDSFKVKRGSSPATDADFATLNVVTPEGGLLNDSGKTLNSDHEVTFTENISVPANTSKTYTLVGNMAAAATMVGGNVPSLAVTSVTLVGTGTVSGLPVEGNKLTTNDSLTLASATFAEGSAVGTVTKQVGTNNVLVASIKLTNGTTGSDAKKIQMEKLTFYSSGTVADADITSFSLKYNNVTLASAPMVGKYVNFDFAACGDDCILDKGYDRTFDVYANLTAGSGRTINLDLQYATHAAVKDVTNGVYITPTDSATGMTNTVTVSQGKLNVTKVNNVPAGNIPKNATKVELASWNFNVVGEPIDIRTLAFKIIPTGTGKAEMLDALILYDKDGKALIGGVDGVGASAATAGFATTTDTFTLQAGDNVLTLKGTVDNNPAAADTFQIGIDMTNTTNFIARGVNSSLDITLGTGTPYATPNSLVTANTKTVQTSALTVTTLSSPAARTYAPGTNDILFAKVSFDASASTEDIKISQVKATDVISSGIPLDLQNISLWVDKDGDSNNGAGTPVALTEVVAGSTTTAADETFTWNLSGDDQFIIKAGKKLTLEIHANIAGGATVGSHTISIATADWVTGTGQTTKNQVTEVISSATASAVTVGTAGGQVEVALSSSNPSAKLFAGGTTVTLAVFNFLATTTEDVEMDFMYLTQLSTLAASTSYKDYDEIWFEDSAGVEISGTRMSPTSTKPYIDFTENALVVKTTDSSGKNLYLKAKVAAIGSSYNGTSGHYLGYKVNASGDIVAKGDLSGTGSTEYISPSNAPTGNTHYVYKTYPVFAKESVSSNKLTNGTKDLFKFKVTAVNGDIALAGFTFDISTTTATLAASSLYLYDVTESTEVQINDNGSGPTQSGAYNFTGSGAVWNTTSTDWSTNYSSGEITVALGTPRTFILRGNITGSTTGASMSVSMAGDAAFLNNGATLMLAQAGAHKQSSNNDFIWSDKNASGHSSTTADWTNGYLVSGLSSTTSTVETVAY